MSSYSQPPDAFTNARPSGRPAIDAPRVNAWLRLTSWGWRYPLHTIADRERARRSRLASWILLGLMAAGLILSPEIVGDVRSGVSVLVFELGLIVAALMNRAGFVAYAGGLIVVLIMAAVMSAVVFYPNGLTLDALPAYDLLAVSVVVAASVLRPGIAFVVAGINIVLMCTDYFAQPHFSDLRTDIAYYGSPVSAAIFLLGRPIALELILAVVSYLWVRGTDEAIRRADRAEEVAQLEHVIVEQKRQLDVGVQQVLQTHIRVANGDFSARAPLGQDNILWQISSSLNNLLARLQRAGNAEYRMQRTEEEIQRLASALRDAKVGRQPIWPAPSGTSVDSLIEIIVGGNRTSVPSQAPWPQDG
jgi:hypothetical protein